MTARALAESGRWRSALVLIAALAAFVAPRRSAIAEAPADVAAFDCYAPIPRSPAFESGDFTLAFKELRPLATDECPSARRLLAILYARGQGAPRDLARAYAYLLLAFSEGVTPFGGAGASGPTLGDDPNEFEIVQFGMQLSDAGLRQAETLAARLVGSHAISSTGVIGPTGIDDTIKELRPRREAYRMRGKTAALRFPGAASALVVGMRRAGADRVLAEAVTDLNGIGIPHELQFAESKIREIGNGSGDGGPAIDREIALAASRGERLVWLNAGARVRIVRYGADANFASQVALAPEAGATAPAEVYWVDNAFIQFDVAGAPRP